MALDLTFQRRTRRKPGRNVKSATLGAYPPCNLVAYFAWPAQRPRSGGSRKRAGNAISARALPYEAWAGGKPVQTKNPPPPLPKKAIRSADAEGLCGPQHPWLISSRPSDTKGGENGQPARFRAAGKIGGGGSNGKKGAPDGAPKGRLPKAASSIFFGDQERYSGESGKDEGSGRCRGQVDHAPGDVRAPIIDADENRAPVAAVRYLHPGSERQRSVGRGHLVGMRILAICGPLS